MTAPKTTANFEECGLNNTTGQTEYNSELGLQFLSRGEQFAAAGGGGRWATAPGPSAGATVQVWGEGQRKDGQDHPGPVLPQGDAL